ncbi:MAG TPA: ATP-binding protein [Chryseolinea sp.]
MIEGKLKAKSSGRVFFTYLCVFLIVHAGSHISLLTRHDLAVADYYLPTALSIILIHWLGPRYVLPVVYLNAVCTSYLWGNPIEQWSLWFLFAIPETLFAFLSWFLFRVAYRGKYWLPDTYNTTVFLAGGVMIPAVVETFLLQWLLVLTGSESAHTFWIYVKSNLLSEITASLCITLPALHYLTPFVQRKGWLYEAHAEIPFPPGPQRQRIIEISAIFAGLLFLSFLVEFIEYWYVYGFFSLFVAIRYGFGPAILTNLYILLITYVLPRFFVTIGKNDVGDFNDVSNIFLGANFLFVFAAITGRVISDVKNAELRLLMQNNELKHINEELDRFIYSVSHDLSAPLKSIMGLVNLSRLDSEQAESKRYLRMIEQSVQKLENFIAEIIDYSRNKRTNVTIEKIILKDLCVRILEDLRFDTAKNIQIIFDLSAPEIFQDKARLKVILNNLITNAISFQKAGEEHQPYIKISSRRNGDLVAIAVEDNGVGIKPEQLDKVFNMFYRGHERSEGSGLGLYIARESALKIQGDLSVSSQYGQGSVFEVLLKDFDGK